MPRVVGFFPNRELFCLLRFGSSSSLSVDAPELDRRNRDAHGPRRVVLVVNVGPRRPGSRVGGTMTRNQGEKSQGWGYIRQIYPDGLPRQGTSRGSSKEKALVLYPTTIRATILKYVIEQRLAVDEPARGRHPLFYVE
jgi:hypothetical protein